MKQIKIITGIIMVLLIGLGVVMFFKTGGFSSTSSGDDDDDETAPEANATNIITVQVTALTNTTLHRYVDGYGMVEAAPATENQPAGGGTLAAPTAGVVKKINVVAGQQVKEGDVLVELDSATATFEYAQTEVQRQKDLFSHQNTSLKNLQDADAQLKSLEIVAPVSGTVTSLNVKLGQAVDSTTIVAEVIDLKRLAVSMKVPAVIAADLQAGQIVHVLAAPPVSASLSFVSPAVDPSDDTVAAWAALPSDSTLRPGQFVQLKIVTGTHTNCLVAPAESIVTDDSGDSTVARVNGHEADQTPVQTGFREGDWVEIQATNLNAGDKVVTVGAYGLADKNQIKIQDAPAENSATNSADAK
ncbi:MAG TPA: efflux RND transporter periplasmic adaptor subunit [Pseudomonadales bacterium]|nr:efflux RND transporter periplasmic adaptor subunit [Pseudomonadales bacterium]